MSWTEIKSSVNSTVGTTNHKPLDVIFKEYFAGERESVTVDLDFFGKSEQEVYPTDGKTIEKVIINKPLNLSRENIRDGVEIAGVYGTFYGDFVADVNTNTQGEGFLSEIVGYNKAIGNDGDMSSYFNFENGYFYNLPAGNYSLVFYNSSTFDPTNPDGFTIMTFRVTDEA